MSPSAMRETSTPKPRPVSLPQSDHVTRFREAYDTHYHRVLGYALRRTANREDASDVVAETFLTAWRRLEHMPAGADARPWLYGIARKALSNHRRGALRRERLSGRIRGTVGLAPVAEEAEEGLTRVAAAFARLRDGERELLALVAWEELDLGEIALTLGCSRNAARIRLHRARRRLAQELRAKPVGGGETASGARAGSLASGRRKAKEKGRADEHTSQ
jgi:RNA polymerase sigma factor (sigma-70 family)